jgi:5'-nucleotidase
VRILLTNDDGITSPGLLAAYKALKLGGHEVYVVAPDRERSGQSHSANFFSYLQVNKVEMPDGAIGFCVNGTPTDCANIGCLALVEKPIDLCISGINTDVNLGYDANYSGTVGAALEAAAVGVPALAISQENSDDLNWPQAGQIALEAANLFPSWEIPLGVMVNLNIPAKITAPGWIWVPLNLVAVREYYVIDTDSSGSKRYKRTRDLQNSTFLPGSDVDLLRRGRITLSPLGPVRAERETLARLNRQFPKTSVDLGRLDRPDGLGSPDRPGSLDNLDRLDSQELKPTSKPH